VRGWLGRKEEKPEEAYQIFEWVLAEAVDGLGGEVREGRDRGGES
jgi:hypothetical protein